MNYSYNKITLDLKSTASQVTIPSMLYDTARQLQISFTDGGVEYPLPNTVHAVLVGKKPDGNVICNDCTVESDGSVRYDFTEQTTSSCGVVECEIRIYDKDEKLITSPRFTIVVNARVATNDDMPISTSEKLALDQIILDEMSRNQSETERQQAESLRIQAEAERVNAEQARQTLVEESLISASEATAAAQSATEDALQINSKLLEMIVDGGYVPTIADNGNWVVCGIDTGKPSRGNDGENGLNGQDGKDGKDGLDGKDANIPEVSSADNGKVLQVVDGAWCAASILIYGGETEAIV